jgi:hypothetical protein
MRDQPAFHSQYQQTVQRRSHPASGFPDSSFHTAGAPLSHSGIQSPDQHDEPTGAAMPLSDTFRIAISHYKEVVLISKSIILTRQR